MVRPRKWASSDLWDLRRKVRSSSSDDAHARKRSNMAGNAKHLTLSDSRNYLQQVEMWQLQAWAENVTEEVQTESGGYEYMAEVYPKSC